jgi:hypothetical protein
MVACVAYTSTLKVEAVLSPEGDVSVVTAEANSSLICTYEFRLSLRTSSDYFLKKD